MKSYMLAIASGILFWLGFAGFLHPALSWFALVPLLFALEKKTPKTSLLLGWLAGLTAHMIAYYWILHTLRVFGELNLAASSFVHLLLCLEQSLQFGAFALFLSWMRRHSTKPDMSSLRRQGSHEIPAFAGMTQQSLLFLVPVAWVASEFLWPQLFPSYFGNSQFEWIPFIQIADITGILGLSAVLALVNAAIFLFLQHFFRTKKFLWKPLVIAFGIVSVVLGYGYFRLPMIQKEIAAAPTLSVGMAQTNIGMKERFDDPQGAYHRYLSMSHHLQERGVSLMVWPETALLDPSLREEEKKIPEGLFEGIQTPLLFGAHVERQTKVKHHEYNAAVLMNADRSIAGIYRKQKLLAFGDYIPLGTRFPILYEWIPNTGRFEPGDSDMPIVWNGISFGMSICYEDILPRLVRRGMKYAPDLFVNLTNDSWFGDTREPMIHLALATFRSVEQRRALVRSTNTGISAFVDPTGKIVARTEQYQPALLIHRVPLLKGKTFYMMFGDWIGYLSLALFVYFLIRRKRSSYQ